MDSTRYEVALADRELEVVQLDVARLSSQVIADRLGCSLRTRQAQVAGYLATPARSRVRSSRSTPLFDGPHFIGKDGRMTIVSRYFGQWLTSRALQLACVK